MGARGGPGISERTLKGSGTFQRDPDGSWNMEKTLKGPGTYQRILRGPGAEGSSVMQMAHPSPRADNARRSKGELNRMERHPGK